MASDHDRFERARARVRQLRLFYLHALLYGLVILFLFLINVLTRGEGGGWWFYWPMLGWGVAVAVHGILTLVGGGFLGAEWEERTIRRMTEDDERRRQ